MSEPIKKVLANVAQNLSNAEKAQARENIGAAGAGDVPANAVLYTAQTLQDYEKAQARQNINAATGDLVTTTSNGLMSSTDKTKLDGIAAGAEVNVQSDWNQTVDTADDYIKNKPQNLVQDASYVHTDNNFTTTLKDKLDGIAAGAEVNDITDVQVDGVSVVTNKVANIVLPTPATEVYLAEYGTATVADISAAKNAGKLVYTLIPGTYYPTVAYLRETTRNGNSANFSSPASDSGSFKVASVTSSGTWSNETLNLAKSSDVSPNKLVFVTTSDTYATVNGYRTSGYDVILKYNSSGSDLFQYFRLAQYNPDGSMEFTCIRGGASAAAIYKYTLNSSSQWTRTDLGLGLYTGTAPVDVSAQRVVSINDGGITYKKISNMMWRKLTASRYNEAYTEPSHTQIIRGSTSDAGRILAYVWDEKKNDQFYMTRSTEQGYASQFVHIDFSCDVRPYSSSYDPTNDTKFNIALVCQNAGGSYAYMIDSEQVQRFNFGTNFTGLHQIHASFDIESDQMSHSYDSNDPELCVIFSARTNITPAWYDTVDGLVFENQRITGFCWGHP